MWLGGGLLLAAAVLAGVAALLMARMEPFLRARIVAALEERFHARVELDGFTISLIDGLRAKGTGLRIWPPSEVNGVAVKGPVANGQPLVRLEEFGFHAPLRLALGKPFHIPVVELKGLYIDLPPRRQFGHAGAGAGASGGAGKRAGLVSIEVEAIECTGARLRLEPSELALHGKPSPANRSTIAGKPGKLPMEIEIAHLKLTGVQAGEAMGFEAELTNPKPVGTIHTTGSIGPWNRSDPGESAIKGDYRFEHADLGGFNGIAGILTSTGHYEGTLRDLTVDGQANVPDFRLTHFGTALNLETRFHARVNATNGDTWLEPVDAVLGSSHFTASGQIVRVPGEGAGAASKGHDIALDVDVDRGRMEDFLRLASHTGTPLLTGALALKSAVHIPPGAGRMEERLELKGSFTLTGARFASEKIQGRIEELSLRGLGRPKEIKTTDPESVESRMEGDFRMAGGVVTLPGLKYTVPGAEIDVAGTYGVAGGTLDFAGTAKMQATVSQMLGGWKGLLLSPINRLFKKQGAGTAVAISIGGTREDPKFKVGLAK